ncbi:MAG: hypothetical protein WC374_04675 [Phycisphaerae bacterium]|jgi:hypothetical protein
MKTNLRSKETCEIINPWSALVANHMTWAEIVAWCNNNVHASCRTEWIKTARQYARNNDGAGLGRMIIGS